MYYFKINQILQFHFHILFFLYDLTVYIQFQKYGFKFFKDFCPLLNVFCNWITGAAHYQNLCMGNLEEEIIGEGGSLRGTYVNAKIWGGQLPPNPPLHSAIPAYAGEWQNSDNKSCVYGLRFSRIPQKTSKKPQNIDSILTSECKPHPQNPCPQPRLKVWWFSRANFKKPQS